MYDGAKQLLLARLPHMNTDALLRLLDVSFAFIEVKDLQDIPLKVCGCIRVYMEWYMYPVCEVVYIWSGICILYVK